MGPSAQRHQAGQDDLTGNPSSSRLFALIPRARTPPRPPHSLSTPGSPQRWLSPLPPPHASTRPPVRLPAAPLLAFHPVPRQPAATLPSPAPRGCPAPQLLLGSGPMGLRAGSPGLWLPAADPSSSPAQGGLGAHSSSPCNRTKPPEGHPHWPFLPPPRLTPRTPRAPEPPSCLALPDPRSQAARGRPQTAAGGSAVGGGMIGTLFLPGIDREAMVGGRRGHQPLPAPAGCPRPGGKSGGGPTGIGGQEGQDKSSVTLVGGSSLLGG